MEQVTVRVVVVTTKLLAVEPSYKHLTCLVIKLKELDSSVAIFSGCIVVDLCFEV